MTEGVLVLENETPQHIIGSFKEVLRCFGDDAKIEDIATGKIYINGKSFGLMILSKNVNDLEYTMEKRNILDHEDRIVNLLFKDKIFIITGDDNINELNPDVNSTEFILYHINTLYTSKCECYNSTDFKSRNVIFSREIEVILNVPGYQSPIVFGDPY